ncbi:MAG: NUDIX hydrolase [Chlamydiales bacterium]|nr:NUDIX hydrolase [Chlamydiia bacterium]MCP5506796.1 NUDIX hydrolase [Chlamydiales bacterium]
MKSLSNRTHYALSVDCVVFGFKEQTLNVALIERKNPPFQGHWAIPGGFIEEEETVEEAAIRELQEETGIADLYLEQFHVFSEPGRDPRGRVITVAFFALVNAGEYTLTASQDAAKAQWWPMDALPEVAFDHREIIDMALEALRDAVNKKPIVFALLPKEFTLSALQKLYEEIFGIEMDKRNFRKKMVDQGYICPLGKKTKGEQHRPAELYGFIEPKY